MKSSTTAIIVSYKSKWIIENCIKSIEQNARIIVVENSNDYKLKKFLEKNFTSALVLHGIVLAVHALPVCHFFRNTSPQQGLIF